jgi:hypothetical protein
VTHSHDQIKSAHPVYEADMRLKASNKKVTCGHEEAQATAVTWAVVRRQGLEPRTR